MPRRPFGTWRPTRLSHKGPTMIDIDRGRFNLLFGTAAFTISSAGSVLLHIVLAIAIYARTGSGFITAVFISLQWLPALLVVLYRSDWDRGMNPRVRWYSLELLSAALTLPVVFLADRSSYWVIVSILLVRGLVDQVNRINKTVATRVLFPVSKSAHYAAFLQSGYHCGIGVAAVVGIWLASRMSLRTVAIIDASTFVIAAMLIALTRCLEPHNLGVNVAPKGLAARIAEYRDALMGDRRLRVCAVLTPLTATFFQGTYSVLQPIFPIERLGLGPSGVSASYVLASVGIIAGSASFSWFCRQTKLFEQPFWRTRWLAGVLSVVAALLYVGAVASRNPFACALLFFLMIVVFEFLWMTGYSGMVAFAPKGQLSSIFGISFAIGCFLASAQAALVGTLLDMFGDRFAVLVGAFMLLYLVILGSVLGGRGQAQRTYVTVPARTEETL